MKAMKSLTVLMLLAGALFMFEGCKKPCKDVTCLNGGTCDEETGECQCVAGYEGADCGVAVNAKFAGTWTLAQQCTTYTTPDTTDILVSLVSGTTDSITFKGLYFEWNFTSSAKVSSDGLGYTIDRQDVTTLLNREIEGQGTVNSEGNAMTISYIVYETGTSNVIESCTGTLTK